MTGEQALALAVPVGARSRAFARAALCDAADRRRDYEPGQLARLAWCCAVVENAPRDHDAADADELLLTQPNEADSFKRLLHRFETAFEWARVVFSKVE